MITIFSNNYLPSKPIERAMKKFGAGFNTSQKVLDIGCGKKPYQKYFICQYIGIDPSPEIHPDVVGNAWELPFADAVFDGIILNQSLEHISHIKKTIQEIFRVLRPGGYVIVSVPQTMRNHSIPLPASQAPVRNFNHIHHPYWHVDYYRFTKYGLIYIFQDFDVVSLQETTGYFGTLFQLINYFFASLDRSSLFMPIYFFNNILGICSDSVCRHIGTLPHPLAQKFYYHIYTSLTINYIAVFKKT